MATATRISGRNGDGLTLKGERGVVEHAQPYVVDVTIKGVEALLFHRYDAEVVADAGAAPKGSKKKKTDNIESYVYRGDDGNLCMPGTNVKACVVESARYSQDPRSPRKCARDLIRAGIKIGGDPSFGKATWDYVDRRRVSVQRNAITRARPALEPGWRLSFAVAVLLPEYVNEEWLNELIVRAGRTIGLGDFRPDFGTFMVESYKAKILT